MQRIKNFFQDKRNLWILGALAVLALFLQASPVLAEWLDRAIAWVSKLALLRPTLGLFFFIMLSAASAIISFFSSAPLVPVAVAVWGKTATAFLLLGSWIIGGIFAYSIAYYFGKPIVTKLIDKEKFNYYVDTILRRATFDLVVIFRLAAPSEAGGLALGILRYPFWKYFWATVITEAPFAFILAYAGEALVVHDFQKVFLYVVLVAIIIIVFSFTLKRRISREKNN